MALTEATLAAELAVAFDDVAGGAAGPARLAGAFRVYFASARHNATSPLVGGLDAAEAAMAGAMTFNPSTGTAGSGAAVITAGVTAWWGSMSGAPGAFFPSVTVITPPAALSSLAAALVSAFAANMSVATRAEAAVNVAAALHPANLGGTGFIPSTTTPIT